MISTFSINLKSFLAAGASVEAPVLSQAKIHPRATAEDGGEHLSQRQGRTHSRPLLGQGDVRLDRIFALKARFTPL